ncbi:MAG TPA: fructosamine kinase family protein [Solirubrobacteraceae bacterium]|nr:fructosamine kinase family protein [Solirubrobacteraceae bacterium]
MTLPRGARVVARVGGGDINEAFRVALADGGEAFVKTRADAAEGEYAAEAAGLEWLARPGALRTPRVLEVGRDHLALEWIERGRLDAAGVEELGRGLALTHAAGVEELGRGLALTHAPGAPGFGGLDADAPSRFGSLGLPNERTEDWPTFYAERRLRPLARIAAERGALSDAGVDAVERVCERMGELVGPPEPAARLHGDLWSGNVMAGADGRPWLIDPSAYGGHREVDLAMLRLFGAPSERVFDAYAEQAPLADGWRERVELYQLLPLLVHALLFGGSYRAAAERAAMRYSA